MSSNLIQKSVSTCTNWIAGGGTYSYIVCGGKASARTKLSGKIRERLYFAGEATSAKYSGTFHGAFFSGEEVAETLKSSLPERSKPIVIVGAGMAGLACGEALKRQNRDVIVLESSNRVGGRAGTDSTSIGAPVHLGASWIHGDPSRHPAAKRGIKYVKSDWSKMATYALGRGCVDDDIDADVDALFDKMLNKVTLMVETNSWKSNDDDEPLESVLHGILDDWIANKTNGAHKLTKLERALMRSTIESHVEGLFNAPPGTLSSREGDEDYQIEGDENDYLMVTPLSTIVEPMAALLNVHLNERVVRIDTTNAQEAYVHTASGKRFCAAAVVVTVPISVLQKNQIQFEPELPQDVLHALTQIRLGQSEKCWFRFETKFWKHSIFGIIDGDNDSRNVRDDIPMTFFVDVSDLAGVPMLMTLINWRHGPRIAAMHSDERSQLLDDLFRRAGVVDSDILSASKAKRSE